VSLVVLDNVSLSFGSRPILSDASLRLGERDRIGLVGPNGSGKTTLLKLISGQQEYDKGSVDRARGIRVGYLPQELVIAGGSTLLDFVLSSVPGRTDLDAQLAAAEAELERVRATASEEELMDLAQRIADMHERVDHFERFFSEHEAHRILTGLGFAETDRGRDLGEFSGGWQMRAVLAALLFQQPDVLLLDEPTNHLDLPSVAWFADFLKRYGRCFILISHDREFLNEQIDRVVSFEIEGLRHYAGNYDRYVKQRAEEEEVLEAKARNLAREREHMEKFVNRFRAQANKAKAVQSRVKALEKMEDVELYEKRRTMRFSFPPTDRPVNEVVRVEGLKKAYGDLVVFPGVDVTIQRGEKIGIIGVNGAGKTTLLKMIAGELEHDAGTIRLGNKVEMGYYAQHHADTLDKGSTVFDEVARAKPGISPNRVRSVLGAFLFSGDDVDKPISVLSGGERARVALARLLVAPGNFMLMDEPTNHLDLESSDSLAKALQSYDGTLVFVSHNRSLIRTLATRVWNVEDGGVETYPGTLDEYMYSQSLRRRGEEAPDQAAPEPSESTADSEDDKPRTREGAKAKKRREADLRNKRYKVLGPLKKTVERLESRIGALEVAQAERSEQLSDPAVYDDSKKRNELLNAYQKAADKLEELTGRWEAAVEEFETAEQELGED
jgi:ATP-binding cassette subfamily F protein 3